MEKIITLPNNIYQTLIAEGERQLPYEACGLLAGFQQQVTSFWSLQNQVKSSSRFYVPKEIVTSTVEKIQNRKEQVLAIFHTHPSTKPVPSHFDLKHHPDDEVDMVILSHKYALPQIKWYQIRHNTYTTCKLVIIND
ncbi:Mov34/MPN/PAD-1 family protein [Gracilibacillus thailandensis]|uniref:MPN domain-containing protein n=1 Tax=Gracilibacillus thailandensis TaxID=563735 RepID=A0A6N7QVY5_9BACI|nr:Mov34/MPN/PAD-1 family protein [Gracilibacillus thailandensis]MRI65312.1 hypothetical protein [Gracilibacillus thailandensis]